MITGITVNGYEIPRNRIQTVDGLDSPPYRVSASLLAGMDGAQYNRSYADKRSIALGWLILEADMSSFLDHRNEVFNAFNPAEGEIELEIEINYDTTYKITCVVDDIKLGLRAADNTWAPALARLTAYDPIIKSSVTHANSGIAVPGGGGATFPLTFPIVFQTQNTGTVFVNNDGNVAAYPILTLTGLLTNPVIRNVDTGEYFQLTYTSQVGDSIVIDMRERTVTLNGATSLITRVAAGSSWWTLQPGSTQVAINTGASSDTGTMEIAWNDAWDAI